MAAGNFSYVKATHIRAIKFGSTAWSTADFSSATKALDSSFATNNASPLMDAVGVLDANNPVKSAPFCKDFKESGGERNITEENLIGQDSNGSQNKEIIGGSVSRGTMEFTLVYRNTTPFSTFNDSTKCCLIEIDNDESTSTGFINIGFNNIVVEKVGDIGINPDGLMEQKYRFSFVKGVSGSPISVSQTSPTTESWSRVIGGSYAEEVRTA